jgi:hypothetical protein
LSSKLIHIYNNTTTTTILYNFNTINTRNSRNRFWALKSNWNKKGLLRSQKTQTLIWGRNKRLWRQRTLLDRVLRRIHTLEAWLAWHPRVRSDMKEFSITSTPKNPVLVSEMVLFLFSIFSSILALFCYLYIRSIF